MLKPNVQDPEFWVEELMPLLTDIDFALKIAVPKAHGFFTHFHKKPINRPVLSNLIRYHALEYLWAQGFDHTTAKEEGADGWGLQRLPNNGIELLYKQSCIRLRKGIDPPYPTTGASEDFYQQALFGELDRGVVTNLLIMFNLDANLQYDGKLRLMRPEKLNARRKLVKCTWVRTVELQSVDLTQAVSPEYQHASELPLDEMNKQE
jgi:hypothetical protein